VIKKNSCGQRPQIIQMPRSQWLGGARGSLLFGPLLSENESYQLLRCDERHIAVTRKMQSASTMLRCDDCDSKSYTHIERDDGTVIHMGLSLETVTIVTVLYLSIRFNKISVTNLRDRWCDATFKRHTFQPPKSAGAILKFIGRHARCQPQEIAA
jgi:hypothetical protein